MSENIHIYIWQSAKILFQRNAQSDRWFDRWFVVTASEFPESDLLMVRPDRSSGTVRLDRSPQAAKTNTTCIVTHRMLQQASQTTSKAASSKPTPYNRNRQPAPVSQLSCQPASSKQSQSEWFASR